MRTRNDDYLERRTRNALARTIAAYEKALAMLRMEVLPSLVQSEWSEYGSWEFCHLCRALRPPDSVGMQPNCKRCPLGDGSTHAACALNLISGFHGPADVVAEVNRSGETFRALKIAIQAGPDAETMIAAFQARLDWIIETAEKNGFGVRTTPTTEDAD